MTVEKIISSTKKRSFTDILGNNDNLPTLKPLREYGIGEPGSRDPGFVYLPFKGDAGKNEKWDNLAKNMPQLLKKRGAFADALNSKDLPEFVFEEERYSKRKDGKFDTEDSNLRADLQMLTAIASGYVNYTDHETGKSAELRKKLGIQSNAAVVPEKLAKPLKQLADMAQVPPMLNYAHYAIDNRKGEIPYTKDGEVDVDKVLTQNGQYEWERVRYERVDSNKPALKRVPVGKFGNRENSKNPKDITAPRTPKETEIFIKAKDTGSPDSQYVKSKLGEDRDIIGKVGKISDIGELKFRYPFVGPNAKGEDDELGFVQVHTVIEAIAAKALYQMPKIIDAAKNDDAKGVQEGLQTVASTYRKMVEIFHLSPAYSRTSEYEKDEGGLRPYIKGFDGKTRPDGVIYEGQYNNEPQYFRGESGAMSSVIPALDELLGYKPPTKFYEGYREYMPAKHREFLSDLGEATKDLDLRKLGGDAFKQAVIAGADFRLAHADNAVEYIQNPNGDAIGTGGSIFAIYLRKNAEHMRQFAEAPQEAQKANIPPQQQSHTASLNTRRQQQAEAGCCTIL